MNKKKDKKFDPTIHDILMEAGLHYKDIVTYNPISYEIGVGDKKYTKGMPKEFDGKKITYVLYTPEEVKQYRAFQAK